MKNKISQITIVLALFLLVLSIVCKGNVLWNNLALIISIFLVLLSLFWVISAQSKLIYSILLVVYCFIGIGFFVISDFRLTNQKEEIEKQVNEFNQINNSN